MTDPDETSVEAPRMERRLREAFRAELRAAENDGKRPRPALATSRVRNERSMTAGLVPLLALVAVVAILSAIFAPRLPVTPAGSAAPTPPPVQPTTTSPEPSFMSAEQRFEIVRRALQQVLFLYQLSIYPTYDATEQTDQVFTFQGLTQATADDPWLRKGIERSIFSVQEWTLIDVKEILTSHDNSGAITGMVVDATIDRGRDGVVYDGATRSRVLARLPSGPMRLRLALVPSELPLWRFDGWQRLEPMSSAPPPTTSPEPSAMSAEQRTEIVRRVVQQVLFLHQLSMYPTYDASGETDSVFTVRGLFEATADDPWLRKGIERSIYLDQEWTVTDVQAIFPSPGATGATTRMVVEAVIALGPRGRVYDGATRTRVLGTMPSGFRRLRLALVPNGDSKPWRIDGWRWLDPMQSPASPSVASP